MLTVGVSAAAGGVRGTTGPDAERLGGGSSPSVPAASYRRQEGPVWFGTETAPLFGWVHQPAVPAGGSVVLCPPLFSEQVSTKYLYLAMARELAAAGLVAVRFDYEGTGDSHGTTDEPGLVQRWLASVGEAVELARACAAGPTAVLGMRMGALLAAVAAEGRREVDALVLWDPCASGRSFLRRLRLLHALRFGEDDAAERAVEVPGAVLHPETASDVGRLRLPASGPGRRTLLLLRPGDPLAGRELAGERGVPGLDVQVLPRGEQEALLEVDPEVAEMPETGPAAVRGWLAGALAPTANERPVGGPGPRARFPSGPPARVRGGAEVVRIGVDVDGASRSVEERCVWLGPLGLFGIETAPAVVADERGSGGRAVAVGSAPGGSTARGGAPVVVFLTSGSLSHVGPARMWVTLARRWAAMGFRCVRVDLSGLGESPVRPGQPERVVSSPEAFDDVDDVVADVAADPGDVVLVGLCSGAYQALESALELAPLGVLAVNVALRFTPPEVAAGGPPSERRRLHVTRPPWVGRLRARLPRWLGDVAADVRTWCNRLRPVGDRPGWQAELARCGVEVYCVGGQREVDGLLARGTGAHPAGASGSFEVEVVEELDHALLAGRDRDAVTRRLTAQLVRMAGRGSDVAGAQGER